MVKPLYLFGLRSDGNEYLASDARYSSSESNGKKSEFCWIPDMLVFVVISVWVSVAEGEPEEFGRFSTVPGAGIFDISQAGFASMTSRYAQESESKVKATLLQVAPGWNTNVFIYCAGTLPGAWHPLLFPSSAENLGSWPIP